MSDTFSFDEPAPGSQVAPGRPVVPITSTPVMGPTDNAFTFEGPVGTTKPKPAKPLSLGENINDKVNLVGTAATNIPMDIAGIPGTASRAWEKMTPEERKDITNMPGDVGSMMMSSALFHELIGKHLPSGEEIKNWFYGATGIPRREPKDDNLGEQVAAGTIQGLGTAMVPGMGGQKILSGLAGGAGKVAEDLFPDNPGIANFATQVLTFLGGGAAYKTLRETGPVARETLGGSAEDRAATALIRASGLPKDEVINRLAGSAEIVPGSKFTTSQAIDTPSMAAAEKGARANNPNAFAEVDKTQAEARGAAADTIAPTGDTTAPGAFLRQTKENMEKNLSGFEQAAADEIKTKLAALGPGATPEQAGEIIKRVVGEHYGKAQKEVDVATKTVLEPNRAERVMFDTAPAVNRIDKVFREEYGRMNPVPSDIKQIRDRIVDAGEQMSWKDMQDLKNNIGKLADDYARSPADLAVVKRMGKIVEDRIDASASSVLKMPEALRRFTNNTADEARTVSERLVRLNELRDIQGLPPTTWKKSREALEDRISEMERGMRSDFGAQGAMNPDEYQRYLHSKDLKTQLRERYEQGAVGDVRAGGSEVGGTDLTKSEVPARFWNTRATSKEDIDQFTRVVGGSQDATNALRNYAVGNLRAIVEKSGGDLTDAQLTRYLADHKSALDSSIGKPIKDELSNLQTAREAIANDVERRSNLLEQYNKTGARHFLSDKGVVDPEVAISKALSPKNPTGRQDMAQLTQLAKAGGPDVHEGMKAIVRDDFVKSTGGFTDVDKAKKWLDANRDRLLPLMGRDHIDTMEAVVRDMSRGVHPAPGNVNTLARMLSDAKAGNFGFLDSLNKVSLGVSGFIKDRLVGAKDTEKVADLFNEIMVDPRLAHTLVTKVTRNTDATMAATLENAWKAINNRIAHDSGVWNTIKGPVKTGTAITVEKANDDGE